jgi:hypothetical protein
MWEGEPYGSRTLEPQAEDIVTFLVGLVGSDGVLTASDKKHTRGQLNEPRNTFSAPKVFLSDDTRLAYCSSGAQIGDEIGKYLIETLKPESTDVQFEYELRSSFGKSSRRNLRPMN